MIASLAVAAALSAAPIQDTKPIRPTWAKGINDLGWVYLGADDDGGKMVFIENPLGDAPTGNPQFWVRQEYRSVFNAALSSRALLEFDCDHGTFRMDDLTSFRHHNLKDANGTAHTATSWVAVAPGTWNSVFWQGACAKQSSASAGDEP